MTVREDRRVALREQSPQVVTRFHDAINAKGRRMEGERLRRAADRLEAMRNEGGHDIRGVLGEAVVKLHDLARQAERNHLHRPR